MNVNIFFYIYTSLCFIFLATFQHHPIVRIVDLLDLGTELKYLVENYFCFNLALSKWNYKFFQNQPLLCLFLLFAKYCLFSFVSYLTVVNVSINYYRIILCTVIIISEMLFKWLYLMHKIFSIRSHNILFLFSQSHNKDRISNNEFKKTSSN